MLSQSQLRERGLTLLDQLHGDGAAQALIDDMAGLCPDFVDMTIEWALGGVMSRPGLDPVTRELVTIASCVTLGHPVTQLRAHVHAALTIGASREQIIEAIDADLAEAGALDGKPWISREPVPENPAGR